MLEQRIEELTTQVAKLNSLLDITVKIMSRILNEPENEGPKQDLDDKKTREPSPTHTEDIKAPHEPKKDPQNTAAMLSTLRSSFSKIYLLSNPRTPENVKDICAYFRSKNSGGPAQSALDIHEKDLKLANEMSDAVLKSMNEGTFESVSQVLCKPPAEFQLVRQSMDI